MVCKFSCSNNINATNSIVHLGYFTMNLHYENMSMQYTAIFHGSKNEKKIDKNLIIFLFLLKT